MLWIQHLRWCRCSVGSKRKMRAESECACQQEWNEVWNLALNFNCAVISRDVWGPWLGRQDCRELETSAAAGTVRDWLTGPCARGRVGRTGEAEMGSDWDRYNWQCYSSASLKAARPGPSREMVKKALKSHCNGHGRGSRLHLTAAPQHTQFSHLCTL